MKEAAEGPSKVDGVSPSIGWSYNYVARKKYGDFYKNLDPKKQEAVRNVVDAMVWNR